MRRSLPLLSILLLTAGTVFAGEVSRPLQGSVGAAGVTSVEIEIPISELRIVNSAGPTVELTGTIEQKYSGRAEREWAEEIVDSTRIEMERHGSHIEVRRAQPAAAETWKAKKSPSTIKAVIAVPAGMNVRVVQSIGEIEADGSFGDLDSDLRIGDVWVRRPRSEVRQLTSRARIGEVHANLGDRIITKEGLFAGETLWSNDGGVHRLTVKVDIGSIRIDLTR